MTKEELENRFYEIYGERPERCLFSPGRVNLIGDHTDYNGGHVLPCAITMGTWFAGRQREDRTVRFYSGNFPDSGIVSRSLDHPDYDPSFGYSNYLMGMIWTLSRKGMRIDTGMDIFLEGDLPYGSGLSSSASIEVGMGLMLKTFFGFDLSMEKLALLAQYSENNYNGMNCGIMDQFVIAMGQKNKALYLDTATLKYKCADMNFPGLKLVIGCTNKKRGLTDSAYNERRSECDRALSILQRAADIRALGELNYRDFEELSGMITDPVLKKRARHAVTENIRTRMAAEALDRGDAGTFGKLMNESHISLRDDYEVSGPELDALTESAWENDGCLGSRMTGAGFGGCNVSLVREEAIPDFIAEVGKKYKEKIGYAADFYIVEAADGTHLL